MQRVYGTLVMAADSPQDAVTAVERAEATMGENDRCAFCDVMFAVPAAIAYADAGDPESATRHLEIAVASAERWEGSAWDAAVAEARAHLALANGDRNEFTRWIETASKLFNAAGQPLDAARCVAKADDPTLLEPALPPR
jgi:hypothetical protein